MYSKRLPAQILQNGRTRLFLPVATVFASLLLGLTASAQTRAIDVGLNAEETRAEPANRTSRPTTSTKSPPSGGRGGTSMRCWNYGRLVLETQVSGFVAPNAGAGVVNLPGSSQKQILDLRSGLCLIE